MRKRLLNYLRQMDALLCASNPGENWDAVLTSHLQQLAFFQHERLIHLLVTLTFGIITVGVGIVIYFSFSPAAVVLLLALLCLLTPYIFHYYILENGVQKMYKQYDLICDKISERQADCPQPKN